ncbi:Nif-specific regulatory protein [Gimesia panareensis]|uniref:Nif-specific regulatory protein n=1 Tax=Gimesia panareensis TaxID=2527978 RepID=A0A517Q6K4_9PLAN|nr:Nif-specific regulatory protein [Gimesia panareensis]
MPPLGIIYTFDSEFVSVLKPRLLQQINSQVTVVKSLPELIDSIQPSAPATIYLDLRSHNLPSESDERSSVLSYLREICEFPVQIVTVLDQFLPLEYVETANFITDAWLEYPPVPEELNALADELSKVEPKKTPETIPESRKIFDHKMHVTTYTPEMIPIVDQISKIARHNVTLLLIGETGTGKTTLASMIHELSPRSEEPFQNIACGALPSDLIESELFGHLRGSFTGAERSKVGRFEAAGKGTLLLDEIDILSPKDQAKLLKVIETGQFEPVGSTESRVSEARLIVAANVELDELTRNNKFRSDLYYRLNVLQFRLPALRERPNDIIPLSLQFIQECCQQHSIEITKIHRKVLDLLKQYSWPGNLRELKNQIQRAVLFSNNGELTTHEFSPNLFQEDQLVSLPNNGAVKEKQTLADQVAISEKHLLLKSLSENGFRKTATAKALGISRVGLYKKMRKYGMLETNKPKAQSRLQTES